MAAKCSVTLNFRGKDYDADGTGEIFDLLSTSHHEALQFVQRTDQLTKMCTLKEVQSFSHDVKRHLLEMNVAYDYFVLVDEISTAFVSMQDDLNEVATLCDDRLKAMKKADKQGSKEKRSAEDQQKIDSLEKSKQKLAKFLKKKPRQPAQTSDSSSDDEPLAASQSFKKRPPMCKIQQFKGSKHTYTAFKQAFKDAFEGVGLSKVSLCHCYLQSGQL
jgi:hypothetical protein